MNYRMIFYTTGQVVKLEAMLMVLPLITALIYGETTCAMAFFTSILIALAIGFALTLLLKPKDRGIFAKEGLIIVSLAWVALSAIGALPFVFSGEIPSYVDAFFETVSGLTTTGASIVTDVEAMSHGTLFWRSFTHWIGGMGILVFVMTIISKTPDRSMHILRAEMPGPIIDKVVPRAKDTARILYLVYLVMTVIEIVLLLCGGMPLFDSLIHAFGTAGTGGFGIKADSLTGYNSYLQVVITIFMLLFGVNFNLYFLMLNRKFKAIISSNELWCYLGIVLGAIAIITFNIYPIYGNISDSLRLSAFQVSSIITTTGYATADFNLWPSLSKGVLLLLMFVGGCAGSTAGGLKVSRVVILFQMIRKEIRRVMHPRAVSSVKFEGKNLSDSTITSVSSYFALYMLSFAAIFLLLCLEPFDLETNFTAVAACFNNVGPGLGGVGPAASYAGYSIFAKILLSIAMLLGRLEIYPLLLTIFPLAWSKK